MKPVIVVLLLFTGAHALQPQNPCSGDFCSLNTLFPERKELDEIMKKVEPGTRLGRVERLKLKEDDGILTIKKSNRTLYMKLKQNQNIFHPKMRTKSVSRNKTTVIHGHVPPRFSVAFYSAESTNSSEFASLYRNNQSRWTGLLILNDGEHILHFLPGSTDEDYVAFLVERNVTYRPTNRTFSEYEIVRRMDNSTSVHKRSKRSAHSLFTLELAVYGDEHLYRYVKERFPNEKETLAKVREIVAIAVNTIHTYFQRQSIGNKIEVLIAELQLLEENPKTMESSGEISEYLDNFCKFDHSRNPRGLKWDYGLLFTGLDMHSEGDKNVLGMAPVSGVCKFTRGKSCGIGEAIGMGIGLTMAHEIGHGLGMRHDGMDDNGCDPSKFVMASHSGKGQVDFSSCSREYLEDYLQMMDDFGRNCLRDRKEGKEVHAVKGKLPGERFPAAEQCAYAKGNRFKEYKSAGLCELLMCQSEELRSGTGGPPLPGTPCDNGKVCWKGKCQKRDDVAKSIKAEERESASTVNKVGKAIDLQELCTKYSKKENLPAVPLVYGEGEKYGISNRVMKTVTMMLGGLEDSCSRGTPCFNKEKNAIQKIHFPFPDGTPCAEGKKCFAFECVTDEEKVDIESNEKKVTKRRKDRKNEGKSTGTENKSEGTGNKSKGTENKSGGTVNKKSDEGTLNQHIESEDKMSEKQRELFMWKVCLKYRNKRQPKLFPFCRQTMINMHHQLGWTCDKYDICEKVVCGQKFGHSTVYGFFRTPPGMEGCE